MALSISGRIAAGADEALGEVLERRLKEETRRQIERQNAAENQMRQQGIDLQRQSLAQSAANQATNQGMAQKRFDMDQLRFNADQAARTEAAAERATNKNRASDIAGVLAMPGMADADKFREVSGLAVKAGSDPLKVIENLKPAVPKRVQYTHIDPVSGQRTLKFANENEIPEGGLDLGREPNKPDRPARENMTPGQQFNATRSLRNDYVRETSAAKTVTQQLKMMHDAMSEIDKGNIPASSEAIIVTFNKILDPTSVVREGEYARSLQGQAYLKQLESQWQKVIVGGNLIPSELKKFVTLSERFADNAVKSARDSQRQIDAIADEFGLNKSNITMGYGDEDEKDAGGGGDQPKPTGGRLGYGDFVKPPQ